MVEWIVRSTSFFSFDEQGMSGLLIQLLSNSNVHIVHKPEASGESYTSGRVFKTQQEISASRPRIHNSSTNGRVPLPTPTFHVLHCGGSCLCIGASSAYHFCFATVNLSNPFSSRWIAWRISSKIFICETGARTPSQYPNRTGWGRCWGASRRWEIPAVTYLFTENAYQNWRRGIDSSFLMLLRTTRKGSY